MGSFNGSRKVRKLVAGSLLVAAFALFGSSPALGSPAKKRPLPCKSGQASTSAVPCTRAWMTAGCASFLPLVHSTFGASLSLAPKQSKVRGALTCDYDRGATINAFGFAFVPKGVTAAIFQSLFADAAQGWTACQAGADASTQTPLALPTLVPGLGTQAYEYDPCPGSAVVSDPSEPTTPDFAVGLVRVGATDYSGGGAGITLTQLNAFWRRLIVKYP